MRGISLAAFLAILLVAVEALSSSPTCTLKLGWREASDSEKVDFCKKLPYEDAEKVCRSMGIEKASGHGNGGGGGGGGGSASACSVVSAPLVPNTCADHTLMTVFCSLGSALLTLTICTAIYWFGLRTPPPPQGHVQQQGYLQPQLPLQQYPQNPAYYPQRMDYY